MSTVIIDACGFYRPTVKPSYCKCGWSFKLHAEDVRAAFDRTGVRWGWRARLLAQPDSEDCE